MLQSHRMARDEIQRVISALKVINAAQNHPAIHELEIQDDLVSVLMDQTKRLKQVEKYFSQSCEDEIPNA